MYLVENATTLSELVFSKRLKFAHIVGRNGAIKAPFYIFFKASKWVYSNQTS